MAHTGEIVCCSYCFITYKEPHSPAISHMNENEWRYKSWQQDNGKSATFCSSISNAELWKILSYMYNSLSTYQNSYNNVLKSFTLELPLPLALDVHTVHIPLLYRSRKQYHIWSSECYYFQLNPDFRLTITFALHFAKYENTLNYFTRQI